ncbi:MAG: SDR family oxidoreductase [Deltaproteobacteria bacterium]|nr:SDR family oxidoreductase [Deltaproteobacteria bacterium]
MATRDLATLITGATGFVGREVAHRLLASDAERRLIALVRAPDDPTAERRRESIVSGLPPSVAERLEVVRGDVASPGLGLDDRAHDALLERIDRIVHCAASVRFDLPLHVARRENVESTREILSLCRQIRSRGREGRLDHVSTAFVAGRRKGLVHEDELDVGQEHRNTYERTKLEAELLCREAGGEIPVVIYRPSIVVGRRTSGETTSYKAAYGPMRLLIGAYDLCPAVLNRIVPLPLPPDLHVDLVPVDWVADAIVMLSSRAEAAGGCFHLAAGPRGAARLRELVTLACEHYGTPRVHCVEPGPGLRRLGNAFAPALARFAPKLHNVLSVTYAYGLGMPLFDDANAREAGVAAPPVSEYFERILGFAARTDFGRRRPKLQEQVPALPAE